MSVCPSASVAATALPMLTPDLVSSATVRVALSPSVNTGALFIGIVTFSSRVVISSVAGFSSTSVTLIVMLIMSVRRPSETVIVTEYEDLVS